MHITKNAFVFTIFLASILGGLTVYVLVEQYGSSRKPQRNYVSIQNHQLSVARKGGVGLSGNNELINFKGAAETVVPAVVFIQTYEGGMMNTQGPANFFRPQLLASGSGVIISDDGYIATNNHVISGADRIEVILSDNRSYNATVVGSDESTDLALIRIDEIQLPFVPYGNSDEVSPGDWVLAIGNPFDLNSTVTAGIVSAKARNIGVIRTRTNLQIESFIQTDAAVNPGNSGGALVNLNGELIGINTAIATQTGSYQGYSFAIPVSLIKKVMDDFLEFGEIKRGLLGVIINDVNARMAEMNQLDVVSGVLIREVNLSSAAQEAGLQSGDIIVKINDHLIRNTSELQEYVARNRPGDQIKVTVIRNQTEINKVVTLRDYYGNEKIKESEKVIVIRDGIFENNPDGPGVQLVDPGKEIWKENDFEPGFIITHIDKTSIQQIIEFKNTMEMKSGAILIEGVKKNGDRTIVAIDW